MTAHEPNFELTEGQTRPAELEGLWSLNEDEEELNDAGQLLTRSRNARVHLRGDGGCQVKDCGASSRFSGAERSGHQPDSSSTSIIICKYNGRESLWTDTFLTDGSPAPGCWYVEDGKLICRGSGWCSAHRIEDDELECHGGGATDEAKFSVDIDELLRTFTKAKPTKAAQ